MPLRSMRLPEAERLWLDIVHRMENERRSDTPDAGLVSSNLVHSYAAQKNYATAENYSRRAISIFREAHDYRLRIALLDYGRVLRKDGRRGEGRQVEAEANRVPPLSGRRHAMTIDVNDLAGETAVGRQERLW